MNGLRNAEVVKKFRVSFYLLGFFQKTEWYDDPLQALNQLSPYADTWNPVKMEVMFADGTTGTAGEHTNVPAAQAEWLRKRMAA